jgi:hypothetical protein
MSEKTSKQCNVLTLLGKSKFHVALGRQKFAFTPVGQQVAKT